MFFYSLALCLAIIGLTSAQEETPPGKNLTQIIIFPLLFPQNQIE